MQVAAPSARATGGVAARPAPQARILLYRLHMNTRTIFVAPLGLALIALSSACPSDKPAAAPTPVASADPAPAAPTAAPSAEAAAEAKKIFDTRCAPCHGATGAGDGPASAGLTPKPANFTSPEWQGQVTDEHIEKIIAYGGMAVGKSAAMPPNPDLDGKPVVPALRSLIRGLKK